MLKKSLRLKKPGRESRWSGKFKRGRTLSCKLNWTLRTKPKNKLNKWRSLTELRLSSC